MSSEKGALVRAKDVALALSVSNLVFISRWLELLFLSRDSMYYMKRLPAAVDYIAAFLDVVLLAAVFLVAGVWARRSRFALARPAAYAGILVALGISLNTLRLALPTGRVGYMLAAGKLWLALFAVVLLVFGVAAVRWRARVVPGLIGFLLVLSPFAGLTLGRSILGALSPADSSALTQPPLAATVARPANPDAPRVVWFIFDEMDYQVAFDHRPPGVKMPEFDRFRAQAFFASNAHPPAIKTMESIPSLTTGRVVNKVEVGGPDELFITFADTHERTSWNAVATVFSRAREGGFETSVVGWYHPYCRVHAKSLTRCSWWPVYQTVVGKGDPEALGTTMSESLQSVSPLNGRRLHTASYRGIIGDAEAAVAAPGSGLVYVHLPVPHTPVVYDGKKADFTSMKWSNVHGYPDNLMLADRALGELRRAMEKSGNWDRSTILISADHPWRSAKAYTGKADSRVPFMVKLAGQTQGTEYAREFGTVLSSDLVLEWLRGGIATPEHLTAWIDQRARTLTELR